MIWQNKRCSILFHLLVPGGKWQTLTCKPVSSANRCNATFHKRDLALCARSRRGTGYQAGDHAGRQCGLVAASDSAKATTTEDRVPAILGTSPDRVSLASRRTALWLLRGAADHHPHPRYEASGDGRGKAVRCRRGAVHLRLFGVPRRLADGDYAEAAAGRGEKPFRAEHPGSAGDLEVPAPLAGLSAAGTAAGSAEAVAVTGAVVRAVEPDGPGFAASGTIDPPAGIRQRVVNADETEVRMLKPGHGKAITGYLSGYAGDADHRYVFYDFRPSRSRDGPGKCWRTIVVIFKRMATSSTHRSCAIRRAALWTWRAGRTVGGASRKRFRRPATHWSTRP